MRYRPGLGRAIASAAALAAMTSVVASPAFASSAHLSDSLSSYQDRTVGSVVAPNGDANPYGTAVVPMSVGKLVAGDLLVADFNNKAGGAGRGSAIVQIDPATGASTVFASGLPISGPVGIAINPVNDGVWVGDFGSSDGSTSNDLLIDPTTGTVKATFDKTTTSHPVASGQQPTFDGVWGQGESQVANQVSFYYGTTGSGTTGSGGGEVWRIDPHPTGTANGQPVNATYIEVARGLGDNATRGSLPVSAANATGPEGFAYDKASGVLYVSDDADNTIYALPGAATATGPVTPRIVLRKGVLDRPENIAINPANGNLLVVNAANNTLVELNPQTGFVLGSRLLDGGASGALFGLAATTSSTGQTSVFYVNDNTNTLHELAVLPGPVLTTGPATHVTATTATLTGVIDTKGAATTWQFQYGQSENYGRGTPIRSIPAGKGRVSVSFQISRLKPGTLIHYRLIATAGKAQTQFYGIDRTFRVGGTGRLLLASRVLTVRNGRVAVPLTCASALRCMGKFTITSRTHIRKSTKLATVVCATTKNFFVIGAGKRQVVTVPVRPACLALLRKDRGRLGAKLTSNPRTNQRRIIQLVTLVLR
jgi:DNA-binding beta-propeller fold protein YncE